MAKKRLVYRCSSCGHEEPRWLGRCPECAEWNTFEQTAEADGGSGGSSGGGGRARSPRNLKSIPLSSIEASSGARFDSGIAEVNRVLGGGIMRGSSLLLSGEPGIGKSTLMLQLASQVKSSGRILYISGEESASQIKLRADRLSLASSVLELLCETDLDAIMTVLDSVKPIVVVVDSIQTLLSADLGSVPGTVNQIKGCASEIVNWARDHSAGAFLVAHVTKEGAVAGPKVVEHMVDGVLSFEQASADIRVLRSTKNRFGPTDEIGLFTMGASGLVQVKDPSSLFMVRRDGELPSGVAVAPVYEGSRVLLVEIQALVVPAKGAISRVFSDRIDAGRVSRVAAVLEKHLALRFSDQDIYVNVAGGIRLSEVGIELPLALALYSARTGRSVPAGTAVAGEISLAGEIRPIPFLQRRVRASSEMGFPTFVGPQGLREGDEPADGFVRVSTVDRGISAAFGSALSSGGDGRSARTEPPRSATGGPPGREAR